MEMSIYIKKKLESLISFLKDKKVIVAFSGGVDSSLLGFISNKYAKETLLITEKSLLFPDEEIEEAKKFADQYNIPHLFITRDPLTDETFKNNPKNRCYICKTGLYNDIIKIKESRNFDIILDGSNIDDLSDYRPGMQALQELKIITPYIEFNINKEEIREISRFYNLRVQSKPSMACFSSRIPYNQIINEEKLEMIKEGEKFLKNTFNLKQLRVRLHNEKLARIELLSEDIPIILNKDNIKRIKNEFKKLGFCYITIDLEGYRSGSLNEILNLEDK